ncbi:3D domain-containing protein [Akkermansiaceae bacterium]|nr:3D domain-containing protein [Akkermansiaceae bacterium]MDA7519787.1 3D domain-containing protein [bacterium]MDB4041680.1 3D domain-containing protein [Akkermansiaceae bacterium]MDB4275462.1 3D domain-containing protein [Akkermansiaceae bacterium]MDB4276496.1 3D domain-containing protein [Akkermansiaceae bacterium]
MKTAAMISIAISILLSSCGEFDSSVFEGNGIHDRKSKLVSNTSASNKVTVPAGKSPDGFLPAPVGGSTVSKVSSLPKDKHGMPTYKSSQRQRYVRTTAYSHMEMEVGAPWKKNAVGTYLKYGQVRSAAADWSRYPVGTKLKIKGLPYTYVVDDYGSALVGTNTVDIYHPTLGKMNRWGTRKCEITVIQWGSMERTVNILKDRRGYKHTRNMYYAAKAKLDSGSFASN